MDDNKINTISNDNAVSSGGVDTNNIAIEIYKQNVTLLDQRRRAEQLLYGVSEAVLAVNTNHDITLFNHAAENLLGMHAGDVIGKKIEDIVHLETEDGQPIDLSSILFIEDPEKNTLKGLILKGFLRNYYINIKSSEIKPQKGEPESIITLTNITKEKELEKTKDDFISITSHELRTPMTIIKSYLWMLGNEKKGPLNDMQKGYLDKAVKGTERMLSLINDTLNISRIEHGRIEFKMEMINLMDNLNEIYSEFKVKTDEKGLFLTLETPPMNTGEPLMVYSDQTKFREIITNFLGNSFKFTKEGGITIKVDLIVDDFVRISIIDTGKGVSAENIERLFHKFGRLDNSYQTVAESGGTGLGLYIVKSLVEKMGGQVGAESAGEGKGSVFWFTLSRKSDVVVV